MLKKLLFGLVGLCATAAIAWGVTLSDGSVTTPVTVYGATGGVSGAAGVGTENSSTQSNVGILKAQAMIYNGSAGNLVPLSSASASLDVNALANGLPTGGFNWNGSSWDRLRSGAAADTGAQISNLGIQKNQMMVMGGSNGTLLPLGSVTGNGQSDANAIGAGVIASGWLFNGTNWDRQRGVVETPSASLITLATTSANGTDQINYNGHGVKCVYDVTSLTGTNTILTIQGKDTASGKYYTLLASAAIVGASTTVLTVFPGQVAAANSVANDNVPRVWRVITTNTAITVFTGTVGCTTLL